MKHLKNAASKISSFGADKYKAVGKQNDAQSDRMDPTPIWTTGQEFQFYVPWLWNESPEPEPDKLHPNRQVVRIPQPTNLSVFSEKAQEGWIQQHVAIAVKNLVDDKEHYPTCTEPQLENERYYDHTKAWKDYNIVQSKCDLPKVIMPGYDGVLPLEMTIVIKEVSIHRDQASSRLEWLTLPSPGKCVERIKNQVHVYLTPECSTHIHIRPQTMLDFDLQAFKKMASLLWLAEERLNKLYHPARSNSDSPFHRSLRHHSNLALDGDHLITGHPDDHAAIWNPVKLAVAEKEKLATIWQASDRHQLRELLRIHPSIGKHDSSAYNFFNLYRASDKQTIEFRKTESTIDAQVIDAWIEVFLLLTDFCMTCPIKEFQRVMGRLANSDNVYSTWNFLRDIGCKSLTVEVLKQKFMQQWLPEEPATGTTSRATTSASITGNDSAARSRLGDAIRDGTKKLGGKIAGGYSYGR